MTVYMKADPSAGVLAPFYLLTKLSKRKIRYHQFLRNLNPIHVYRLTVLSTHVSCHRLRMEHGKSFMATF